MEFLNIFDEYLPEILAAENSNSQNILLLNDDDSLSINNKKPTQKKKRSTKLRLHFTPKNAATQKFPFRSTLLQYILVNQNSNIQRKLQQCCKWFFIRDPILICEKLSAKNSFKMPIRFCHYSIFIGLPYFLQIPAPNYCISVEKALKFDLEQNRFALSQLIFSNFIQICTAEYITIENQDLWLNELSVLIGSGNVTELELSDVNIFHEKNEQVKLEEILKLIPNVKNLKLSEFPLSSSAFDSLTTFTFKEKLNNLVIDNIKDVENFNPACLIQFLKNNISTKSNVEIIFKSVIEWDEIFETMIACKENLINGINSCFNGKEKPNVSVQFSVSFM